MTSQVSLLYMFTGRLANEVTANIQIQDLPLLVDESCSALISDTRTSPVVAQDKDVLTQKPIINEDNSSIL